MKNSQKWVVRVYSQEGILVGVTVLDSNFDSFDGVPITTREQAQKYANKYLVSKISKDYAMIERK